MRAAAMGSCAKVISKAYGDHAAVALENSSFAAGSLRVSSYARPGKLFTASTDLIAGRVGELHQEPLESIVESVVALLRRGRAK
jgi:mRNA interferase MazF